jgi:ADP-ribose pyrophosphatase YjhB (NUDIX family)
MAATRSPASSARYRRTMGDYVTEMRKLVGSRPLLLVAAGVVVQAPDGTVLLQRRTDDGLWGLPGGALEPGESLEGAARRELFEETGLVAGELSLLDVYSGPEFFLEYPNGDQAYVVGATFLARADAQVPAPDGQEGSRLAYFALSALPVEMSPYNRRLLHRCRHLL